MSRRAFVCPILGRRLEAAVIDHLEHVLGGRLPRPPGRVDASRYLRPHLVVSIEDAVPVVVTPAGTVAHGS